MDAAILTIQAPLASWSEGGAHYRPTDLVPSWSAITGLVGAAFGWGRYDERLVRFASEYALAVRVINVGERLVDYHTIQSPHRPALKGKRIRTRADELQAVKADGDPHTTITNREYVQDVNYEVGLIPVAEQPLVDVTEIVQAARTPIYPLYAGRRSCVLGYLPSRVGNAKDWLATATHWDDRLKTDREGSLIRERRDLLVNLDPRRFATRREVVL